MRLEKKLTRLTIGIFITVILIISVFSLEIIKFKVTDAIGKSLIDIAFVVSSNPMIQNELANNADPTHLKIQNFTERVRLKTGLLFITVMNNDGIRYSHPIPDNIGRKFIGGDEKLVLRDGETYVSEGEGHLGKSLRGFTPIYKDGVQVGAVSVGILKRDIVSEAREYFIGLIPVFVGVLVIIIFLAKKLARNIKSDIYGLEPEEIANELREKESIINNIEEGLIAINNLGEVTVINSKAYEILKIGSFQEIDEKIINLLYEVIYRRGRIFNKEIRLKNNIIIMGNFYSIIGEYGKIIGAIASFQDFTKVHNMAEELTGVKELTWNLRTQDNEFMNKLHRIVGLIQLEENDKALEYIFQTEKINIVIKNNGRKINDDLKEKIFNRGYSTKGCLRGYGAIDYLIKPFKFERFKEALINYKNRFIELKNTEDINQNYIDKYILNINIEDKEEVDLCKGLNLNTYNKVIEFIKNKRNEKLTAEEIAKGCGLARVTARRYLEKMVEENKVDIYQEYGKIGRPTNYYKMK